MAIEWTLSYWWDGSSSTESKEAEIQIPSLLYQFRIDPSSIPFYLLSKDTYLVPKVKAQIVTFVSTTMKKKDLHGLIPPLWGESGDKPHFRANDRYSYSTEERREAR